MNEQQLSDLKTQLSISTQDLDRFTLDNIPEFVQWCEDFEIFLESFKSNNNDHLMLQACLRNKIGELANIYRESVEGTKYTSQYILDWRKDAVRRNIHALAKSL